MASIGVLTDLQKSDKYQRTLSLNFDCRSDALRKTIETHLNDRATTLKMYLGDLHIQSEIRRLKKANILYRKQVNLLNSNNPDLESMDVTLLTTILLALFPVTNSQMKSLEDLKEKRNELAHKPRSMLDDDIPFIEASKLILALAKDISDAFEREMNKRIEKLKKRELVRTRSNMDVIILNNEALLVKLVEAGENENVDGNNETWIKLGLTKYVRQLARSLDVDILLQKLKGLCVINDTIKRTIEKTYNYEDQMQLLVLHMMDETRENLLKFCACLRQTNSLLADLVQHKPSDERELELCLKKEESKKMIQIIQDGFDADQTKSVTCEDVHIFVESRRKCTTQFPSVIESMTECFPGVCFEENDSRFRGIKPKDGGSTFFSEDVSEEISEEILTNLPCDKFGVYLAKKMNEVRDGIGSVFEEIAVEECISSNIFGKLTDEQMESLFEPPLKQASLKYGFGIKAALSDIQKNIIRQLSRECTGQHDTLRKFDTPAQNISYPRCSVRPSTGNLLTPSHEFVYPAVKKQQNVAFLAKEVIRFALACINGKKNGTIHFGIRDACNGTGDILGLRKDWIGDVAILNREIHLCTKSCFQMKYQLIAERCIRPVQVITVEEDMIVLEVDVVPFSCHVLEELISIKFPPKGNQRNKCFAYQENTVITLDESRVEFVEKDFIQLFEERLHLEKESIAPSCITSSKVSQKLRKLLTGGNRFVTDGFVPVVFTGNISGCHNEDCIRKHISNMSVVFTSAAAVFDFDSSVILRNMVEMDNDYFQVKHPEDFSTKRMRRESDMIGDNKIWLYSNGNEEVGKERMSTEMWYSNRLEGIQSALNQVRLQIPADRGLLVYLVFQKPFDQDPMLEVARETFLKSFKDECIVIAEEDTVLQDWRREMKGRLPKQDFEDKIITGMAWDEISSTVKSVFRPSKDVLHKFSDSRGHIVDMTSKELDGLQFQTLELVDGYAMEQCRIQEEEDDETKCRERRSTEEEMFYRGNEVTWWNCYYSQVGKRDMYDLHKDEIKCKLLSMDRTDRYEIHHIRHNPGAGGSTLARHILWHFSQMKRTPDKAYRCCIVQRITDDTAEEIYRFKTFKDKSATKPVIVLVDNKSEEHLNTLKSRIDEISYKKGSPGKLFCLILAVTRVPVSHKSRQEVLGHNLSVGERIWFTNKFEELDSCKFVDVHTLIAFNVMRNSFDAKFIDETTERLFSDITSRERMLLEVLSLICSFDSDSPVPDTVFDSLMLGVDHDPNILRLEQCLNKPFGIVWSEKQRRAMQPVARETWNVSLTGSMQLFITHRKIDSDTRFRSGVCILSMPLSKSIMTHIMETEKKSFEYLVNMLLDLLEQHCGETNAMSKQFIKIVCSLFTYRETFADKGETKVAKFSALVLHLEKQLEHEKSVDPAQKRVIRLMERCFDISGNAMVGQQLARYHYYLKNYQDAENAVKRCLSILPQNSYILDTYGQIFKSKMEQIIGSKAGLKMNDVEAAEFIELGFKAVEKFKRAQQASTFNEDFNWNCFYMEVVTAFYLLENFHRFECFEGKESFWCFLNDTDYVVNGSPYANILKMAPVLEQFRNGGETQCHIHDSLRTLEEKAYMTRTHLTPVMTPSKDVLLLKPRERFEQFYGSKEHTLHFEFLFGVGLKLLMRVYQGEEESHNKLARRANEAESRLYHGDKTEEERDLLVYLGYSIIAISNHDAQTNLAEYRKLLNYSAMLWQIQREKRPKERQYVEAYLYYALLHWLTPRRIDADMDNLSHPETYKTLLKNWETVYKENNFIKNEEQLSKEKPKIYFALGNENAGNDIVDLEWLRHKWREAKTAEGRNRKEVKADNHWHHRIFEDRLLRLPGTVNGTGKLITTEVLFNKRSFPIQVQTNENHSDLSNRAVTFVLAFSWKAPVALDVRRADKMLIKQTSQSSLDKLDDGQLHSAKERAKCTGENATRKQQRKHTNSPEVEHPQTKMPILEQMHVTRHPSSLAVNKYETQGLPQRKTKNKRGKGAAKGLPQTCENKLGDVTSGGLDERRDDELNGARQKSEQSPRELDEVRNSQWPTLTSDRSETEVSRTSINNESEGAVGSTADCVDNGGLWSQVRCKKKIQKHWKEQPEAASKIPISEKHSTSRLSPKENFEALISTCQKEYPHKSKSRIIQAYDRVKKNHHGDIKHLGTERIVKEVGEQL